MCGATGAQKEAQALQTKITNLLTSNFQLIFNKNQGILDNMMKSVQPTVNAGSGQYGYSPAEDAARRTQATESIAAANRNATGAVRGAEASQGGGMNFMPSGSQEAIDAGLADQQAFQQAQAQNDITAQGYETGRQNYFQSLGVEGSAPAALETPGTQAGSTAMGAAGSAMQGATDIAQANQAWMAPVGAALGAIGSAAIPKPK